MGGELTAGGVVLLSGGTGGAKLARGLFDVLGPDQLTVIANTGDDIEIYGAHVSPDPDLVTFWLADRIDSRGWGIAGDTFMVMEGLRELGVEVWFNLGDRDLAWCLERKRLMEEGLTQSEAHRDLVRRLGLRAAVVPMADLPYRTFVNGLPLQRYLIQDRSPPRQVELRNAAGTATPPPPAPLAAAALAEAELVLIGPSNPVISIQPILAVLRPVLAQTTVPLIFVSPFVGGKVLKGPTDRFLASLGLPADGKGALAYYSQTLPRPLSGVVSDEPLGFAGPELVIDTDLGSPERRRQVAEAVLEFGERLRR